MVQIVPPIADLEAEQAVLGSILLDRGFRAEVAGVLTPDDFYGPDHRLIFRAMQDMEAAGEPIDLVTVTGKLRERGQLD